MTKREMRDMTRMKTMLSFLEAHYAEELMLEQIAEICGFLDMSYFSRSFRQLYNTTPTEYRNLDR